MVRLLSLSECEGPTAFKHFYKSSILLVLCSGNDLQRTSSPLSQAQSVPHQHRKISNEAGVRAGDCNFERFSDEKVAVCCFREV